MCGVCDGGSGGGGRGGVLGRVISRARGDEGGEELLENDQEPVDVRSALLTAIAGATGACPFSLYNDDGLRRGVLVQNSENSMSESGSVAC